MKNEIQGEITTLTNFKYFFSFEYTCVFACVVAYIYTHTHAYNIQHIK